MFKIMEKAIFHYGEIMKIIFHSERAQDALLEDQARLREGTHS